MANVELNVRTELNRIVKELEEIASASEKVDKGLKDGAKGVGEGLNQQAKKTERFLTNLQAVGGRVAHQLRQDFKSLAALNFVTGSLKFSEMFRGSVAESFKLSDSIRKLGSILGVAENRFTAFQSKMMRGLGELGISSEAAGGALEGLAQTPVRGEENLIAYTRTASQLASVSRETGRERDIAKGMSEVVTARGGAPNDLAQMRAVANDLLRIRQATGKSATEILTAMKALFSGANQEFQARLRKGGGVTLSTAALLGGEGSTAFLERYLKMSKFERMGAEAQGLGRIIDERGGLNLRAMESTMAEATSRGMGDAAAGLQTFGFSQEEAQGFIRLTNAMKENAQLIEQSRNRLVDLNRTYRESMGLVEAFEASLNRLKGIFSGLLSTISQVGTNLLTQAAGSDVGAAGVVGGAGILSALMAGAGLKGVGAALGMSKVAGAGAAVTGAGMAALPFAAGGAALGGGVLAGKSMAESNMLGFTRSKTSEGFEGDVVDRILFKLDKLLSGRMTGASTVQEQRRTIKIELNKAELKPSSPPPRGVTYGP